LQEKSRTQRHSGYHGAWREHKLLIIQTVNAQGKTDRTFSPFMDATMKGPDAVFSMLRFYLEKIGVTEADKVLFIADGARWIWNRVGNLFSSLGLSSDQCYELLDFYHAAQHLNKIAGLQKKLNSAQRKQWFGKHRKKLKNGKNQEVVQVIKQLCRGVRTFTAVQKCELVELNVQIDHVHILVLIFHLRFRYQLLWGQLKDGSSPCITKISQVKEDADPGEPFSTAWLLCRHCRS
jgi:REP element-mobilizing transposase RayT